MGSALLSAYRDYLERVFEKSDELLVFDRYTVPLEQDLDSPALREWGDFV